MFIHDTPTYGDLPAVHPLAQHQISDDLAVGQLALYSLTPNPFNSSTRITYAVNGGTSERVDIGIYNVACKLVRKLVSDMEAPGYHEAVWDGRSDGGVQVTPGGVLHPGVRGRRADQRLPRHVREANRKSRAPFAAAAGV